MKILFICSSLEPGRDGVGDYTRRLACELQRKGHSISILALHDRHLPTNQLKEHQAVSGEEVNSFRMSSRLSWKNRMELAEAFVNAFDPEWLSLQYVPFGFQKKGLTFGLGRRLKNLGKGRKWHIMFHELWVGMGRESSLALIFWGWVQRQLIKELLHCLTPDSIHSQAHLYCHQLKKLGWQAELLPLFGNIPLVNSNKIKRKKPDMHFIVFGSIYPGAPVKDFAQELARYSQRGSVPVTVVFAGRNGIEQKHWVDSCQYAGLQVQILGEQPSAILSEVFTNSDFGIVTTPVLLAEKSGTVAALMEHQLPVLCVAQSWFPRKIPRTGPSELVYVYQSGGLPFFLEKNHKKNGGHSVTEVGMKFVDDLTDNSNVMAFRNLTKHCES